MGKYDYLKQFVNKEGTSPRNWFYSVSEDNIRVEEDRLGFLFPEALKEFWREIGYGSLKISENGKRADCNLILAPDLVADMILLKDTDEVLDEVAEYLSEGDIPFFEIGDSSNYLVMKNS